MAVNLAAPDRMSLLPVAGVDLGFAYAGIRKFKRNDVMLMRLAPGARVAGVFTQNAFAAAPVQVCRQHLAESEWIRALVVNAGNANCGTGEAGLFAARRTCEAVARGLGCQVAEVLPFSTGVILEDLPVREFWRSSGEDESDFFVDLDVLAAENGVPVRVLGAGETIDREGARITVVHSGGPRRKVDAINNQSLVFLFERDGRSALLTGDASAATEEALLWERRVPRADILKVGHHGSRSSTTTAFLEAVCPRAALISCGRENRFGHPAPATLQTLVAARVPVFRTDLSSDLRIDLLPDATRLWSRGLR